MFVWRNSPNCFLYNRVLIITMRYYPTSQCLYLKMSQSHHLPFMIWHKRVLWHYFLIILWERKSQNKRDVLAYLLPCLFFLKQQEQQQGQYVVFFVQPEAKCFSYTVFNILVPAGSLITDWLSVKWTCNHNKYQNTYRDAQECIDFWQRQSGEGVICSVKWQE